MASRRPASPAPSRRSEPVASALADALAADARRHGLPGLAVALVTPDRRCTFAFGVDAHGSARPVDDSTWFALASTGKHATAIAVLALVEEGLIDLAAPVGRYLTDLPPSWRTRSVDSLLRHTSGLPEYLGGPSTGPVPERRCDFIARYGDLEPVFAEGEGWIYSNTNYIVLGLLVDAMRGRTLARELDRLVGERLGGDGLGVAVASPDWTRRANRERLGAAARDAASQRRQVSGDGDVSLTAGAAAAWIEGLLDGALVAEPWRSRMWTAAPLATGRPAPYGQGWFVDRLGDAPICHHGGHFDGWTAMAYLAPSRGAGVLATSNAAPGHTRAIRSIALKALEAIVPGSTPLALAAIADERPDLTAVARAQLLRAEGAPIEQRCFADELLRVAARGGAVRNVINVRAGVEPLRFELVEEQRAPTHTFRRYRLVYEERVEHLLVGTTPDDRIFWAWPL